MRITGITSRELATLLYALRRYQAVDIDTRIELDALAKTEHFHEHAPLNPDEVDELCARLNIPETVYVDHIDGDPANNEPSNLRLATLSENRGR